MHLGARASPEVLTQMGTLVQDALALISDNSSAMSGTEYLAYFDSTPEDLLPKYDLVGCPDLSRLVRFVATYTKGSLESPPCDPSLHSHVIEMVSWLLCQRHDPIKQPLATALATGSPIPGSGVETLIQEWLQDPKSTQEFYAALSWCVNHRTLPVSPSFEPPWPQIFGDGERARALSTAWCVLRTIVLEPSVAPQTIGNYFSNRTDSAPVARELMLMLYNGSGSLEAFQDLLETLQTGEGRRSKKWAALSGPATYFALTAGLEDPALSGCFLKVARGERFSRNEIEELITRRDYLRSRETRHITTARTKWCASHLFQRLENVAPNTLSEHDWTKLIKIGRRLFPASEPYTPESAISKSLFTVAAACEEHFDPYEVDFLRLFLRGEEKKNGDDYDDTWDRDHDGESLRNGVRALAMSLQTLGLEQELTSCIFTDHTLDNLGPITAECINHAVSIPPGERVAILQRALRMPEILGSIGPSVETLHIVANTPGISNLDERVWVTGVFDTDARRAEILSFLNAGERQLKDPPVEWQAWTGVAETSSKETLPCYSGLEDRLRFIENFAPLIARTNVPLEALYERLNDPAYPSFTRETWLVSYMLRFSTRIPESQVLSLFENLVSSYKNLWNDAHSAVTLHMRLLELSPFCSPYHNEHGEIHLLNEFTIFKEHLNTFGRAPFSVLYRSKAQRSTDDEDPLLVKNAQPTHRGDDVRALDTARLHVIQRGINNGDLQMQDLVEHYDSDLFVAALRLEGREAEGARERLSMQRYSDTSFRPRALERRISSPLAHVKVHTVTRSSKSEEVQQGCMEQVRQLRECFTALSLSQDLQKVLEQQRDVVLRSLSVRGDELLSQSGDAQKFAQQSLEHLMAMRKELLESETAEQFINACARPQPALGKRLDDAVTHSARVVGFKAVQELIPSRLRGWSTDEYTHREHLEGCASLLDEIVRQASLDLTPNGRALWKRIFSVRSLQREVARLHALDLATQQFGKDVTLSIYKGSPLLADHAGYLCQTCVRDSNVLENHRGSRFFVFTRGADATARNIGGAFVFNVRAEDGEKAYLIRGFNPTQTTSLEVDVGAFFEHFVDLVAARAAKNGVKRIVVPYDLYSGRAQTNRPSVHAYIADRYYKEGSVTKLRKHEPLNGIVVTLACVVRNVEPVTDSGSK